MVENCKYCIRVASCTKLLKQQHQEIFYFNNICLFVVIMTYGTNRLTFGNYL